MAPNIRDKRKIAAEQFSFYPLLYAPTTERRRAQRGTKRSRVSSKNIFRSSFMIGSLQFL